jgi:hypothetical protein
MDIYKNERMLREQSKDVTMDLHKDNKMKWEYKSRHFSITGTGAVARNKTSDFVAEEFNALGAEGWELVQILFNGDESTFGPSSKIAVFKRQKQ